MENNTKVFRHHDHCTDTKNGLTLEPCSFTVIQTYATRLQANQAKNEIPTEISTPTFTTRQGLPAVILKERIFW